LENGAKLEILWECAIGKEEELRRGEVYQQGRQKQPTQPF
jgi:hypothetical protein